MRNLKSIIFKIIIIYVISYIILSSTVSSFARIIDDSSREQLAQYTREFISKYGGDSKYTTAYGSNGAGFKSGTFGQGTFGAVCTTGVAYMYELALGINIYNLGYTQNSQKNLSTLSNNPNWEVITDLSASNLKPGDILTKVGHTEMYLGNNQNGNFGNAPNSGNVYSWNGKASFTKAFRLKNVDVTVNGNIPSGLTNTALYAPESTSIYNSQGFVYQGMPESEGYEPKRIVFKDVFNSLSDVVDWIIGLSTYLLRAIIIGYTAIVENIIIDGIFDTVTGTGKIDESQTEDGEDITESKIQKIAENVSKDDRKPSITVENMVYNKVPFLDANVFNLKTAGGQVVEEGSVIYIIKTNVAAWYYALRAIAIAIMLAVLIYLGFKLAFNSIAEKKALYKQMLLGWTVGFILLFLMHYIMIIILQFNEEILRFLVPTIENGTEYTLYETVRTMAYEIKASTGWAGTIIYIVLVYYAIRFLYTYLKRLLHIVILTILSPIVALSYAIEKVNRKGGRAGVYGNWLKDFTLTVSMQSIHALVYTLFISTILKLTQVSLVGILMSFVFLNFMLKAEKIFSKIFGFGSGTDFGRGLRPSIITQGFFATMAGKRYKKYAKSVTKPVTSTANKISEHTFNATLRKFDKNYIDSDNFESLKDNYIQRRQGESDESFEKRKNDFEYSKRRERESAYRAFEKNRNANMKKIASTTLKSIRNTAGAVLTIPAFIIDPEIGVIVLGRTISGYQSLKKEKYKAMGISARENRKRIYSLIKEYPGKKDQKKVIRQLLNYLDKQGIDYEVFDNGISIYDKNTGTWKKLGSYRKVTNLRYKYEIDDNKKSDTQKIVDAINIMTPLKIKDETGYKNKDFRIDDGEKIELLDENNNVIKPRKSIKQRAKSELKSAGKILLSLNGMAFVEDLKEISDQLQLNVDEYRENALIIQEAHKKEDELIKNYRDVMDNSVIINTPNETELSRRVRERTINNFNKNVKKLVDPIDFEDIKQAVENYKERSNDDVKNRINQGIIKRTDYTRIAEEINNILEANGDDRRVNEELFTDNIAIAVEASRHKNEYNIREMDRRLRKKRERTTTENNPIQSENQTYNFDENTENINEDSNINIEEIIKMIQNSTSKPEVKYFNGVTSDEYRIANIINEMKEINEKSEKHLRRKIWNVDRIMKSLKTHYENNNGDM
ncbi:MAG: hypothetical protein IKG42_02800 [Clostridia bacterium]|nr:hypothetical protein [Clostridia bacterium]